MISAGEILTYLGFRTGNFGGENYTNGRVGGKEDVKEELAKSLLDHAFAVHDEAYGDAERVHEGDEDAIEAVKAEADKILCDEIREIRASGRFDDDERTANGFMSEETFAALAEFYFGTVKPEISKVVDNVSGVFDSISDTVSDTIDSISDTVSDVVDSISDTISSAFDSISDFFSGSPNKVEAPADPNAGQPATDVEEVDPTANTPEGVTETEVVEETTSEYIGGNNNGGGGGGGGNNNGGSSGRTDTWDYGYRGGGGGNNNGGSRGYDNGPGSSGFGNDGWSGPSHGGGVPVVIDLDGDGIEYTSIAENSTLYDIDGDGYREAIGWVGADDAILAYDMNGDGQITERSEIALADWKEGAVTDLQGLTAFDTNNDGVFDAKDDAWSSDQAGEGVFRVWQDVDGDGVSDEGELRSLEEVGIERIVLSYNDGRSLDGPVQVMEAGEDYVSFGHANFEWADGGMGIVSDVAFSYTSVGIREDEDGSISVNDDQTGNSYVSLSGDDGREIDLRGSEHVGVFAAEGDDQLIARADEASVLSGGGGDDKLFGGTGDDWLIGGSGADTISGGSGSDRIWADSEDTISGGAGHDTVYVSGPSGIELNVATAAVEAVYGHESGNDILDGSASAVDLTLSGKGGDDTLLGGRGDDILVGGAGADTLSGGMGDDILFVDSKDSFSGGDGIDMAVWMDNTDLNLNVTDYGVEAFFSGDGNDTLTTNAEYRTALDGGGGDDTLTGGWGGDLLSGGTGVDVLEGGFGNDTYTFSRGDGQDTITDAYAHTYTQYGYEKLEGLEAPELVTHIDESEKITDTDSHTSGSNRYTTEETTYTRIVTYSWEGSPDVPDGAIYGSGLNEATGTYETGYWMATKTDVTEERNAGENDVLEFGPGIEAGHLNLKLDGSDLLIVVAGEDGNLNSGDEIKITNWTDTNNQVETIRFNDGTEISIAGLESDLTEDFSRLDNLVDHISVEVVGLDVDGDGLFDDDYVSANADDISEGESGTGRGRGIDSDDIIFVQGDKFVSQYDLTEMDTNTDGTLTLEELEAADVQAWQDEDRDRRISGNEYIALSALGIVSVALTGEAFGAEPLRQTPSDDAGVYTLTFDSGERIELAAEHTNYVKLDLQLAEVSSQLAEVVEVALSPLFNTDSLNYDYVIPDENAFRGPKFDGEATVVLNDNDAEKSLELDASSSEVEPEEETDNGDTSTDNRVKETDSLTQPEDSTLKEDTIADGVVLSAENVHIDEDETLRLNIDLTHLDVDGSEALTLTVRNVPDGVTLSHGTYRGGGVWELQPDELNDLYLRVPEHNSDDFDLVIQAKTQEMDGSQRTDTATLEVKIDGVADGVVLSAENVHIDEDETLRLNIDLTHLDVDGSEVLTLTVRNVPDGATLSHGTYRGDGVWELQPDELNDLYIRVSEHNSDDFDLVIQAKTQEMDGSQRTDTATLEVKIDSVADIADLTASFEFVTSPLPIGDDHVLGGSGSDTLRGDDDSNALIGDSVALTLGAFLPDSDGSEVYEIDVVGLPIGAALSAGQLQPDGVWRVTEEDVTDLRVFGAEDNLNLNLVIRTIDTDPDTGEVSVALSNSQSLNLTVSDVSGDDTLVGEGGNDVLRGLLGEDSLHGGDGDDILLGGGGDDKLFGNSGDDVIIGGDGNDIIYMSGALNGYEITPLAGDGSARITDANSDVNGDDGTDSIQSAETVVFGDGLKVYLDRNNAPITFHSTLQHVMAEDTTIEFSVTDLLDRYIDYEGDDLIISEAGGEVNGDATLDADNGRITFRPDQDYNGDASFTFTVADGQGGLTQETVTLDVTPVNDAPVQATVPRFSGTEDITRTIFASDILSNFGDVDGDTLLITSVGSAKNGSVKLSGDDIIFNPNQNYNGNGASFKYIVSDGNGGTTNGVANLTFEAVNDAPTYRHRGISAAVMKSSGSGTLRGHDVDGGDLDYIFVSGPSSSKFNFTLNAETGKYSYSLKSGVYGTVRDDFEFYVQDDLGLRSDKVSVDISAYAEKPSGGGGGGGCPVVVDMDGDGVELVPMATNSVLFDIDDDGTLEDVAWIGGDDALLAYDYNGDENISQANEIVFSNYHTDAKTDLEGLSLAFDTNEDGLLSALDEEWDKFGLWQDANMDGETDQGEFVSLTEAGVESIGLVSDGIEYSYENHHVFGETVVNMTDGTTKVATDTVFEYREVDSTVQLHVEQLTATTPEGEDADVIMAHEDIAAEGDADTDNETNADMDASTIMQLNAARYALSTAPLGSGISDTLPSAPINDDGWQEYLHNG